MILLVLFSIGGGSGATAGGISIETPPQYRVFQRGPGNSAAVPVRGSTQSAPALVRARAVTASGKPVCEWTGLKLETSGEFSGKIQLPAGGWYRIEVEATGPGGETVAKAFIDRVGVGEVFVCAGQSNAANFGEARTRAQSDLAAAFDGVAWSHCDDPLRPANGDGGSPWPTLADLLIRNLGVPVAFASVAVGGTSVDFWQPGAAGYERLRKVMTALGPGGARAVLWHQGETDAASGMSAAEYERKLENTIRSIRIDSGFDTPWLVARASYVPEVWEAQRQRCDAIRSAQRSLWDRGVALPGPDTDTMRSPEFRAADRIHFSELGLRVHGERWFAAVWRGLFEGTTAGGL